MFCFLTKLGTKTGSFDNVPLLLSFSGGREEYDGKKHPADQIDLASLKLMPKTCDLVA